MEPEDLGGPSVVWSRRAVLVALAGLAAGCAVSGTDPGAGAGAPPVDPAPPGSLFGSQRERGREGAGLPPPTTPPPAEPSDRGAVAARYQGKSPTQWGTDLPSLLTAVAIAASGPRLALTFDACGGPGGSAFDTALLELLARENIPATLFLNERWITANPLVVAGLMAHPLFELANHGTRHVPLSVTGRSAYRIKGTSSAQQVIDEVATNQDRMTHLLGAPPRWFRAGTAYYDDVAAHIVSDLGVSPVGFAVNGDAGGTAPAAKVAAALIGAPDRAVVLMHMNRPSGATRQGLATALPHLRQRGVRFVTLSGP